MDQKLKELCGGIDYNNYWALQRVFTVTGLTSSLLNITSSMLSIFAEYNPLYSSAGNIAAIEGFSVFTALWLSFFLGKSHNKNIKEITNLYNEFIINYNKLNKTFELSNPIEIYTMFNYLLRNGYLSVNKEFEFSKENVKDIRDIMGVNVINGQGVCRHIAPMFTDILNNFGIESCQLGVYSRGVNLNVLNVNVLDYQKYTKDYLIAWAKTYIPDEIAYKHMVDLINKLIDEEHLNIEIVPAVIEDKNPIFKQLGNHTMTLAYKDGKSYYLDPSLDEIYRIDIKKDYTLYGKPNIDIPIIKASISHFCNNQDLDSYLKIKHIIESKCPSISLEKEIKLIYNTKNKYTNNMDILEHFYNENKGLYEDISSRMLKLKKPIIKLKT